MSEEQLKKQFQQIEDNFNAAVISNNVDEIKKCITSDWVLVDSQGGMIQQEGFFSVLKQGQLSHSTMTKEVLRVKVYGDVALVTGRGQTPELGKENLLRRMNGLPMFTKKRMISGFVF